MQDATQGPDLGLDTPQEMVGFILFLSFLFTAAVTFLLLLCFLQSKMFVADVSVEQNGKLNTSMTRTLNKCGFCNVTHDI